jgi:hypothetical protein
MSLETTPEGRWFDSMSRRCAVSRITLFLPLLIGLALCFGLGAVRDYYAE